MKRVLTTLVLASFALSSSSAALAAGAATSANAGSSWYTPNGTAFATAEYQGDAGWSRTDARSGRINTAGGVAVGVDDDVIALSVSNAIAPRHGPALATNFNLSIDRNGQVGGSFGVSAAHGPEFREAGAGGSTATTRHGGAVSEASGRSDDRGSVTTRTGASNIAPRGPVRQLASERRGFRARGSGAYGTRFAHAGFVAPRSR